MSLRLDVTRTGLVTLGLAVVLLGSGCTWLLYPEFESVPQLFIDEDFNDNWWDDDRWEIDINRAEPQAYSAGGVLFVFNTDNTLTTDRSISGSFTLEIGWMLLGDTTTAVEPIEAGYRTRLERPGVTVELSALDLDSKSHLRISSDDGGSAEFEVPWNGSTRGTLRIGYVPMGPARGVVATATELGLQASMPLDSNVLLPTRFAVTASGTLTTPRCLEMIYAYR